MNLPSRTDQATGVAEPAASAQTDLQKSIRLGRRVLLAGFGAFLLWAVFAPLDEGVVATATVSSESRHRPIQHMTGGVVRRVLVKEGQVVKAGQPMIELDEAAARATVEAVRENYLALRAAESRLLAEQAEARTITFHPDLATADALMATTALRHIQTQTQLFEARRRALESDLGGLKEQAAGLQAQIQGYGAMIDSRQTQLRALSDQLAGVRELAAEGYAPRNQVLQLEQQRAEVQSGLAELQANRAKVQQGIAELNLRMTQRRADYHREAGQQLADVQREVQAGQDKLRAAGNELSRVVIKAPTEGQVVNLQVSAEGGVVTPGQKIMDLVPLQDRLLLDARIPPHVIDRVKVGAPVSVRFSAFANSPQLVLDATLVSVSKDAISEPQPGGVQTYYLGRAEVSAEGRQQLGDRIMQPGMPAEVLVRTGERSLLTYLLHPLTKRVAAALKEE